MPQKTGKLQMYLKWLASSKRKTGMNRRKLFHKTCQPDEEGKVKGCQERVVITRAENVIPNAVSPLTCHVGAQNMSLFGIAPTVANPQPAPPNYVPANSCSSFWNPFCLFASVLNRQVIVLDVETVLKPMVLYPLLRLI